MKPKGLHESPLHDLCKAFLEAKPGEHLEAIRKLSSHLESTYYYECDECEGRGTWNDDWRRDPQQERGCKGCDETGVAFEPENVQKIR